MTGILTLGFLIGMLHALEADHLVAVGALSATGPMSRKRLAYRGAVWGLGHTLTLFVVSSAVLLLGFTLTDRLAATLEFGVGMMLVLLGLDVIRRLVKNKVHFHAHRHHDGRPHLHAHSHADSNRPHRDDPHHHAHPERFPVRVLLVGLVHGAAGSAGLLALVIAATRDPWIALGYVLLFGLGSILGMALLSLVVAWPLGAAEKHAKWLHRHLSVGAAGLALYLGVSVMLATASAAFG